VVGFSRTPRGGGRRGFGVVDKEFSGWGIVCLLLKFEYRWFKGRGGGKEGCCVVKA